MTFARRLTYDFLELPYVVKVEIASEFGLIRADFQGNDQDFDILMFQTIRDAGRIEELRARVDQAMKEDAN